jgi:hypothetical protein
MFAVVGTPPELRVRTDNGEAPAARVREWLIERQAAVLAGVPTLVDRYPAQKLFAKLSTGDFSARLA